MRTYSLILIYIASLSPNLTFLEQAERLILPVYGESNCRPAIVIVLGRAKRWPPLLGGGGEEERGRHQRPCAYWERHRRTLLVFSLLFLPHHLAAEGGCRSSCPIPLLSGGKIEVVSYHRDEGVRLHVLCRALGPRSGCVAHIHFSTAVEADILFPLYLV